MTDFWKRNSWAQLCNSCGQTVATFAGVYHTIAGGTNLAYHIGCIPAPVQKLVQHLDPFGTPKKQEEAK